MYNYTYCTNCGEKLTKGSSSLYICPKCDFHLYINPKPAAGIVIANPQGEILLIKRSRNPKKNYWDIPGGFINAEETAEEAAKREAKEETGIQFSQLQFLGTYVLKYPHKGITHDVICIVYSAKLVQSPPVFTNSAESSQIKFFPPNKIPFAKLAFNNSIQAIRQFLRQ